MGRCHCLSFARQGADIAAVDICNETRGSHELSELNEVASQIRKLGRRAIGIECDVTKGDQVRAMVERVLGKLGRIDILVNNAGIVACNSVVDIPEDEWDKVIDVDLKGVFLCCKYVVPHMIKQKSGKIINISSVNGAYAMEYAAHYCAAKFGVVGFTQSLAREVAKDNVNVNAVGPGDVKTRMLDVYTDLYASRWGIPQETFYEELQKRVTLFGREITCEDVSNAVVWLASEDSRNITGQLILVDGGHK